MKNPADGAFDLAGFLPYKLSVLSRLTQSLLASTLVEAGITIAQWRVYLCLVQQGPSHLNGIADFTMLPQSSLSRSIAQMAERGLVRSLRNENDRRLARIDLTAQGRKQFGQLTVAIESACESAFAMGGAEEREFLATIDELITRLANRLGVAASPSASPEPDQAGRQARRRSSRNAGTAVKRSASRP